MAKRDKRHLYFRDRKAWREWKASLPPLTPNLVTKEALNLFLKTNAKVVEGKLHLRLPNDFTVTPPIDPAKIMTFEQFNKEIAEPEMAKVYAPGLDTDLDWVEKDKLDFMVEVEAGAPLPTRTAQSYLAEMMEVVEARGKTHGSKAQSFAVIAEFRSLYLRSRIWAEPGDPESAVDEGIGMALHKIGRFCQGEQSEEHLKDAIGYLACSLEILAANATSTRS